MLLDDERLVAPSLSASLLAASMTFAGNGLALALASRYSSDCHEAEADGLTSEASWLVTSSCPHLLLGAVLPLENDRRVE